MPGGTLTVDPRKGTYDKPPWSGLDLASLEGQTIEESHVHNVYLGETLAPYVTLEPLRAALPFKRGEHRIPTDKKGEGGIRLGDLERRMRDRWRTISRLWEDNKAKANKLNLVERLDYHGELTAQLSWQEDPEDRPVRVVYSSSGEPTAAILPGVTDLVENVLFWVPCKDIEEASYLMAIINSVSLYAMVFSMMPKGLFGARHLHKHLWKLPVPAFEASNALHLEIAEAGRAAATGAKRQLAKVRKERPDAGVAVIRREIRAWLRGSRQGKAVESAVGASARRLGGRVARAVVVEGGEQHAKQF